MTTEQLADRCIQNGKDIAALDEKVKSAHKRIDENDRITEGIHKLAANVEALALQVKMLTERMDTTIERMETGLKNQGERIGALEKEPAGKWKTLVSQVVSIIVAGLVGGAFANFIG